MLEIVKHPSDILRRKAEPLRKPNLSARRLLDDMAEAMYAAHGVGLAANQVGVARRLVVIDVGDGLLKLINPEIVRRDEEIVEGVEGCLSIPGLQGKVPRHRRVQMRAMLPNGRVEWFDAEGLFAVAIQHEIDHLDGVLFIDRATEVWETTDEPEEDESDEDSQGEAPAGGQRDTQAAETR